jgi:hypothetical protein
MDILLMNGASQAVPNIYSGAGYPKKMTKIAGCED